MEAELYHRVAWWFREGCTVAEVGERNETGGSLGPGFWEGFGVLDE